MTDQNNAAQGGETSGQRRQTKKPMHNMPISVPPIANAARSARSPPCIYKMPATHATSTISTPKTKGRQLSRTARNIPLLANLCLLMRFREVLKPVTHFAKLPAYGKHYSISRTNGVVQAHRRDALHEVRAAADRGVQVNSIFGGCMTITNNAAQAAERAICAAITLLDGDLDHENAETMRALLSKLRAEGVQAGDDEAPPIAPDDEAISECWITASDSDGIAYDGPSFERGYRAALASAPVAAQSYGLWWNTKADPQERQRAWAARQARLAQGGPVAGAAHKPVAWRAVWTKPKPGSTAWCDARKVAPPAAAELATKGYSLELAYAAPQASAEQLVRYCPGCGSIGPVEEKYRDCCPDGDEARMIPAALAEKCRDTFNIAVKVMLADAAANDRAAPQASKATRILFPTHLRKMWSGGEVQAWLDDYQGITPPKASAKGSLERYRQWQAEQTQADKVGAGSKEHQ